MPVATHTVVIYTETHFIAEVYQGETYQIPSNVMAFDGTIEQFRLEFPHIIFPEDED